METRDRAPLVTICVATYNRRGHLELTLESLRRQSLQDFELLVCDDASTDGTFEYLKALRWPQLRVLRNDSNLNLYGTFTRIFGEARGEFIGMQHDHDLYDPEFLSSLVRTLRQNPSAGFVCCAYHVIDYEGRRVSSPMSEEFSLFPPSNILSGAELIRVLAERISTPIAPMGTLYRREMVVRAGGYSPRWRLSSDEDLYRRVAAISDVAFCRERLFSMRERPPDRTAVLGSWKGIIDNYAFRHDTTERYFADDPVFRRRNHARLAMRQNWAALLEGIRLWSCGEREQILRALTQPEGPGARPLWRRTPGRVVLSALGKTALLGAQVGRFRKALRNPTRLAE